MTVPPNSLRCLQQMLNLGEVCVRVTIIDERIQIVGRFPNAFLSPVELQIFSSLAEHEIHRLLSMVLPIKLGNTGIRISGVVTKLILRFTLPVAYGDKVVPFVEAR